MIFFKRGICSRPFLIALILPLLLVFPWNFGHTEIVRVQILQTTDLHGYLEHSRELESGGGILRAATFIEQSRARFGAERTLLIDSGDTVQGTWEAAFSEGEVVIKCLNYMKYDAWVPGNHELDFGIKRLYEMCRSTQSFVTAANLVLRTPDGRQYAPPPWRLFKRGGARIAVIGMTSPALDSWFWGDKYEGYSVSLAVERLEEVLPEVLASKPDMIILAAHQGWLPRERRGMNEISRIARLYPEIDLILGGHTHWEHAGKIIGHNTWYVQAGRNADMVGVVFATIDTDENQVVDIASRLVNMDESIEPHAGLREHIAKWLQASREKGNEIVGRALTPITASGRPGSNCAKTELLCRAIAEATGADAVIHGRLTRFELDAGPITRREVYLLAPYENGIGVAELTGREIMTIMEEQYENRDSYAACGLWGLYLHYDKNGNAKGVYTSDGKLVPQNKRYRVAFNSYTLAGGGRRFPALRRITRQPGAKLTDTGLMTRDVVESYIRRHTPIEINPVQWLRY